MSDENALALRGLLDDIKAILLLANQEKLDEAKRRLLKAGSIESQVYDLRGDGSSTQEIAVAIQKSPDYASAVISNLRKKGLVRTTARDGTKFHEQRL